MPLPTPKTDKVLEFFRFKTKDGFLLNDVITPGQKEIMEAILTRQAPDGSGRKRVHIMTHTRYGKSIAVAAATAIRASNKRERWAIVAPTKDQALIIMDYLIYFCVHDPILSKLLATDAKILKEERITQRRARDHITFLDGGEVRVFHASQTMGFGAPNIILDEAGLITNKEEAKIFRMLGDSTDNFIVKIGNPWHSIDEETGQEHHFYISFRDPAYYTIDIDVERGIREGRITEKYHEEVKDKPHYEILYKNTFPEPDQTDKDGYLPLFSHKLLKNVFIEPGTVQAVGNKRLGADPADGGSNESVIAIRSLNLAKIVYISTAVDVLQFADDIITQGKDIDDWFIDKQGVGTGTIRKLQSQAQVWRKTHAINTGQPLPKDNPEVPKEDMGQYLNLRAWIGWKFRVWLEQGGKIEKDEQLQKQMASMRYKSQSGKLKLISKDELRKRGINDLGRYDAIAMTFCPKIKKVIINERTTAVQGGVQPYYPDLGL